MAKKKNNKKHGLDISCPYCHTKKLVNTKNNGKLNTKVKRFPKTHLIKFDCGFAFLYNTKTDTVFTDIDWTCSRQKNTSVSDYNMFLEDVRKAFHVKK